MEQQLPIVHIVSILLKMKGKEMYRKEKEEKSSTVVNYILESFPYILFLWNLSFI